MSLQGDQDTSLIDVSRDENDSDPDGKSRTRHLRLHEKLSSPARVRYELPSSFSLNNSPFHHRPLSETLREAAERQGTQSPYSSLSLLHRFVFQHAR